MENIHLEEKKQYLMQMPVWKMEFIEAKLTAFQAETRKAWVTDSLISKSCFCNQLERAQCSPQSLGARVLLPPFILFLLF